MGNIFAPERPYTRDAYSKAIKRIERRRFNEERQRRGELSSEKVLEPATYEDVAASIAAEVSDEVLPKILLENPEWFPLIPGLHASDFIAGVSIQDLVLRHLRKLLVYLLIWHDNQDPGSLPPPEYRAGLTIIKSSDEG